MNKIICNHCKSSIDISQTEVCANCGAIICESCSKSSGDTCPYCFSELNHLS